MKNAIILTHGPIGKALIEAVYGILGMKEGLWALSVTEMSVTEISERLLSIVNAPDKKDDGFIIMASLRGGSCWNVAVAVAMQYAKVKVVSGVNLPMVLSFMTKRDNIELDDLIEVLIKDGVRGMCMFDKK